MAKDPAFLFYTSDFINGTKDMTNEEVGIYIRLLCRQHDKSVVKAKYFHEVVSPDSEINEKFVKDEEGNYYNVRLRAETEKRAAYSQSRRDNRLKAKQKAENNKQTHDEHMSNISKSYDKHMENENENENINTLVPKKKEKVKKNFEPPTIEQVVAYFLEKGYTEKSARRAFAHYEAGDWYDSNGRKVKSWKQKMTSVWFTDENKQVDNYDSPNEIEKYRGLKGFDEQIHTCGLYYPHLENDEDGNKKIKYYPHGYRP